MWTEGAGMVGQLAQLVSLLELTASLSVILRSQKGTKLMHTSGACPGDGSYYY